LNIFYLNVMRDVPALLAEPAERPSLMQRAYEQLRRDIIELRRAPGSVFTEADVVSTGGWSKTPVREALTRLHRDGLVTPRHRAGWVVTPVTLRDARELCDLRILLQSEAAALTAGGGPDQAEVARMRELSVDDEDGQLGGPHFEVRLRSNYELEWSIARLSGNARLIRSIVEVLNDIERVVRLAISLDPGMPAGRVQERRELVEAIAAGDPDGAREAMRRRTVSARTEIMRSLAKSASLEEVAIGLPLG
jgi:GntR family transcriptional regulator, rspAB operon transcriptional repressor